MDTLTATAMVAILAATVEAVLMEVDPMEVVLVEERVVIKCLTWELV